MGITKKPRQEIIMTVSPLPGTINSCRASSIRNPVAPKVKTAKISLYFLVFLMAKEHAMAPPTPNRIRKIAAIEIDKSLYPNGFIRKLALAPKI